MRVRPIRPNVYMPFVRFGVNDSDWKYIFGVGFVAYVGSFFTGISIYRLPLEAWAVFFSVFLSYFTFIVIRHKKRPFWLQHRARELLNVIRFRTLRVRGMLPLDPAVATNKLWILTENKDHDAN